MMRRYDVCLGRDRALVFDDVSVFERTCLSEKVDKVVGYGTDCTCNGPRCNQDAKYAAIPVVGKLVQRWQDLSDLRICSETSVSCNSSGQHGLLFGADHRVLLWIHSSGHHQTAYWQAGKD